MNPNNAQRLQVYNGMSPSLRVAVSPTPQPTIMVGGSNPNPVISVPQSQPAPQPTITLPNGNPASSSNSGPANTWGTPPPPSTSLWDHILNAGKDVVSPFINVGEDVANTIGNAEVRAGQALGIHAKTGVQTNAEQFGNSTIGIPTQPDDLRHFVGNTIQAGLIAAAPFTGGESLAGAAAIDAGLGAGYGAANTFTNSPDASLGDYAKSAGIGALFGGAGRFVAAGAGKLLSKFGSSADALSNAVSQESNPDTIQAALNTTPELSHFLAQETDPAVIKNVLNEAGVNTGKNSVQALANAQSKNAPESPIPYLDQSNPLQSQLPAGFHPDNAPDPVPVLENAARSSASVEDFQKYIDGLTGEEKAAATSALNGMAPEDFYKAAGGGTSVPKPAETASSTALPAEDQAAIKAAGGTPPTVPTIPEDATTQAAVNNVLKELRNASRSYNQAEAVRAGEKASRAAAGGNAFEGAGGGEAGLQAKLGAHAGEYTKSTFGIDLSPADRDSLINSIEKNPNLQPFEKLNAQMAIMKLSSDTPNGPTPYDIGLLRRAFGKDFGDAVEQSVKDNPESSSLLEKAGQVAGIPKSVMASGDISATFRQGAILGARHPIMAAKAFTQQLKYLTSEDAYKQGMAEIASRPTYPEMLSSKLAVTGTEALDKTEEQYVSNLAEKLPILGYVVRGSDRAFTGFLTRLRADVFDGIVNSEASVGNNLSEKELSDIARVINTASGRGDLGQFLEQHSQTLSTALFSPRLWKSRLDVLNPVYYAKLTPRARTEALQAAGAFATEAGAVLWLFSNLPGVSVSTDPKSADFLKIKYKNERYDVLGGLEQNLVFAAREITGQTTNSQTGVTTPLGSKYGGSTRLSILSNLIQNKENPLLSAASQLLQGKDRGGNPVNPWSTIGNLVVPLPVSGAFQTAQDFGNAKNPIDMAKGTLLNAPDLIGISAQNYGSVPSKFQGPNGNTNTPSYNGPITPNMVTDYQGNAVLDKNGKPVIVSPRPGATPEEVKAMVDTKRPAAVKAAFERTLPPQTQELMKLNDTQLQEYVKSGQITQADYDHIKNVQKTADSISHGNNYTIPQGANSDMAKNFFSHWNMMDAKDQEAWLKQSPDANSQKITDYVNSQRSAGLAPFQPSNQLAQLYAKYESDINSHDGSDPSKPAYTPLDLRQKAKSFQTAAAKLSLSPMAQDIYQAGGDSDVKTLASEGKITKADLDAAINLDNQLYSSGLTSSLKFSKTFRNSFGYGVPSLYGSNGTAAYSSGSGSGSSGRAPGTIGQKLTELLKTPANTPRPSISGIQAASPGTTLPKFSAAMRSTPVSPIKFKAPNVTPSKGGTRVTIAPYRTQYARSLSNVAE